MKHNNKQWFQGLVNNIIRPILNFCNDYSSPISAVTTIVLAIFAGVAIYQTHSIIGQQKTEEFYRLRAYVDIVQMTMDLPTNEITVIYNNGGLTPAINLHMSELTIDNQPLNVVSIPRRNIGPGATNSFTLSNIIEATKIASEPYPFKFVFSYKVYSGQCIEEVVEGLLDFNSKQGVFSSVSPNSTIGKCRD